MKTYIVDESHTDEECPSMYSDEHFMEIAESKQEDSFIA